MAVQVIPIPTEVVSHSLPFPFPILCFIPVPKGFSVPLRIPFPCTSQVSTALRHCVRRWLISAAGRPDRVLDSAWLAIAARCHCVTYRIVLEN